MNAIVGDNGILTNAQTATIKSGMAVLEEYFQEEYVELYETIENDNGINKSRLERLMEIYPEYFYIEGSKDYVIQEYSFTDSEGIEKAGFLKLRLIRKNNIPSEISSQLKGGDAIGLSGEKDSQDAYEQLIDVYGITSDLKIFYCSNGIETSIGADYKNSDIYDGTKPIYTADSGLSKAISDLIGEEAGDLSMQDLRTIDNLNIDDSHGITDLSALADLTNLKKLTLTNYTGSLKGIERAYKLTYLYFNNTNGSQNIDFTGLRGATKLTELYFYNPTDEEVGKMCDEMKNTDYTKLQTFGLYKYMQNYYMSSQLGQWYRSGYSNDRSTLSSVECLDKLSQNTKNSITVMYIQNNSLTNLNGLEKFSNIYTLVACKNYLTEINAISNMNKLGALDVTGNKISNLVPLEGKSNLKYLKIHENTGITTLESVSKLKVDNNGVPVKCLTLLYASDLTNLSFTDTSIWTNDRKKAVFTVSQLYLPTKYALTYLEKSFIQLDPSITDSEYEQLRNNTFITELKLDYCKNLSQEAITSVLPTMPNLQKINLSNTNLNSLEWLNNISDKTVLRGLNIQSTAVTDILPVTNFPNLGCLVISGSLINIYKEGDTEYNKKIENLIMNIYDHNIGSWADTCLGYGGFIPNSEHLQSQMKYLTGVNRWSFNNGPRSVNVDLSGWTSLTYLGGYNGSGKIILPRSIKRFGEDASATFYLDNPENDFAIDLAFSRQCPVITNNTKNYTLSANNTSKPVSYYQSLFTPYLTSISISANSNYKTNTQGVDYTSATNLKDLTLTGFEINTFDFDLLPDNLEKLSISNCQVRKLSSSDELKIANINFANNNISSVSSFIGGEITTLNLQNNNLSNYETISGTTKLTTQILAEIDGLQNVYLAGNNDIKDFSPLINAGFKDDGNHNFSK